MSKPLAAAEVTMPCGLKLENRLVKAAMEECLASPFDGLPSEMHEVLYTRWSERSGFGLMITGNVQVDASYVGTPFDVRYSASTSSALAKTLERWKEWRSCCGDVPCLMQLNHPGRQSPRALMRGPFTPSIAPSAVPIDGGSSAWGQRVAKLAFGPVREASTSDLTALVQQFAAAARTAHQAGFAGVQIHCSHGYLLAQMMSPKTNRRTDEYGNTPFARLKLLFDIIDQTRVNCPPEFCISVKISASDYVEGGLTEDEAFQQFQWIVEHGKVDMIEISGGSYESPVFAGELTSQDVPGSNDSRTQRHVFFQNFSKRCKDALQTSTAASKPLVMLTGGFRTQAAVEGCLSAEDADLIGMARPACVDVSWPLRMLQPEATRKRGASLDCVKYETVGTQELQQYMPLQIAGYGLGTGWHTFQMWRLARQHRPILERTFLRLALENLIPAWISAGVIVGLMLYLARILDE